METMFNIVPSERTDGFYGLEYYGYYVEVRLADEGFTQGLYNTRIINLRLTEQATNLHVFEYAEGAVVFDVLERDHFLRNLSNILINLEFYMEKA